MRPTGSGGLGLTLSPSGWSTLGIPSENRTPMRLPLILTATALALSLTACGGGAAEESSPSANPSGTESAAPTETAVPTATAAPTASPTARPAPTSSPTADAPAPAPAEPVPAEAPAPAETPAQVVPAPAAPAPAAPDPVAPPAGISAGDATQTESVCDVPELSSEWAAAGCPGTSSTDAHGADPSLDRDGDGEITGHDVFAECPESTDPSVTIVC